MKKEAVSTARGKQRPATQWYWADWLRAPEIRGISLESRGFWMDLLAIMHAGEPYGHLTIGGRPIDDSTLARMVGTTPAKVRKLTAELEAHNVFSRTDLGIIYSRRMVRDEEIRNVRAENGKLGGNPSLIVADKDKGADKHGGSGEVNQTLKQKPTPSSAVAVASASSSAEKLQDRIFTAQQSLAEKLGPDYASDLESFLRSLRPDQQHRWIQLIDARLSGMHPPAVQPAMLGRALRQFIANGDKPNWALFEGYIRRQHLGPRPPPSMGSSNGQKRNAQEETRDKLARWAEDPVEAEIVDDEATEPGEPVEVPHGE